MQGPQPSPNRCIAVSGLEVSSFESSGWAADYSKSINYVYNFPAFEWVFFPCSLSLTLFSVMPFRLMVIVFCSAQSIACFVTSPPSLFLPTRLSCLILHLMGSTIAASLFMDPEGFRIDREGFIRADRAINTRVGCRWPQRRIYQYLVLLVLYRPLNKFPYTYYHIQQVMRLISRRSRADQRILCRHSKTYAAT